MGDSDRSKNIKSSFAPVTKTDWLRVATKEIDGKDPMVALRWSHHELGGAPYYDRSDIPVQSHQIEFYSTSPGWLNLPVVKVLEEAKANEEALHHLLNGADGVLFDCHSKSSVAFHQLLEKIEWPHCHVCFVAPEGVTTFTESLFSYAAESNHDPTLLRGFLLTRTYPRDPQTLHKVVHSSGAFENFFSIGIQTQHESPVDQISELLSLGVASIDILEERGTKVQSGFLRLFFSLPIGTDFFMEIAKLKALRWLWFQVARAYGLSDFSPSDVFIHAQSHAWAQPVYHPHENMLKGTTASIAAILGGCNALTNHPEDYTDNQVSRIARNVSNILREESYLSKVTDATAGSYYLDSLVNALAAKAWEKFKQQIAQA